MGPSERLFDRVWSWLAGRAPSAPALDGELARLAVVASALAGRTVAVRIAPGDGGLAGEVVALPAQLSVDGMPPANTGELALARVVIGALALRAGLGSLPPGGPAGAAAAWSYAACARGRADGLRTLPGLAALLARVEPWLLAARPAWASLAPADRGLEWLARAALGAPPPPNDAYAPLAAWLTSVSGAASASGVAGASGASVRGVVGPAGGARAAGDEGTCEASSSGNGAPARALPAAAMACVAGGRARVVPLVGWLMPHEEARSRAGDATPPGGGHHREGRAQLRVRRQVAQPASEDNPLVHSFEKVHTAERYQGGRKAVDGADELAAHGAALDELALDEVTTSAAPTHGIYQADVLGTVAVTADAEAADEAALRYDEWDAGRQRYRRGFCVVRVERVPVRAPPGVVRARLTAARAEQRGSQAALRRELARLLLEPTWIARQRDGVDIDLDAAVDRHATLAAGHTGDDKLYVARPKRPAELAVLLLLDRSLSSDAWVAGRRVLDVALTALVALGDALAGLPAPTAVLGFHSHTHLDCRIAALKGFFEPWDRAYERLVAVEPEGYTRIGPAIRHGAAALRTAPARRRRLIAITDGRPTDFDRYEGAYGVADVQRAVLEARRDGVACHCVALDPRSLTHLRTMFGPGGFTLATRPDALVTAVSRLYVDGRR